MGLALLLLLPLSTALVFENPAPIAGQVYPYWQYVSQYNRFPVSAPFWNQTYPTTVIGDGCSAPPAGTSLAGRVAVVVVASRDMRCLVPDAINNWNPTNPVAYLWADYQGITMWGGFDPYNVPSNSVPIFVSSFQDIRTARINDYFTNSAVLFAVFPNITIRLDSPSHPPYLEKALLPGPDMFVRWFGGALGVVIMVLSIYKLGQLVLFETRVTASIPQLCLALSFCSGFFMYLMFGLFGGSLNHTLVVPYDSFEGIFWFSVGFYYSALVLMGFYLGEVSRLSSAQGVPGLSVMRIPAAIFLAITWAILIAEMGVTAGDASGLDSVQQTTLFNFFFAWIGVVLPFAVSAVLLWGVFSLLISLSSSGGNTLRFIRVILISLLAVCTMWTFLLLHAIMAYVPADFLDRLGNDWGLALWNYYWLRDLFMILGVSPALIGVILNFQVSVQKEIELSKSGTSSTSGSSSSSSSGSSSSSSADPVIEL